jgi:hypothetical protein
MKGKTGNSDGEKEPWGLEEKSSRIEMFKCPKQRLLKQAWTDHVMHHICECFF